MIHTGAYLRVEGSRRVRIRNLPVRYYAHYLGDEIICTHKHTHTHTNTHTNQHNTLLG